MGKVRFLLFGVKKVDTFFAETACVSGSISCALTLPQKIVKIKQPSGAVYIIIKSDNNISIVGKCAKLSKKSIKLKKNINKLQKKYNKIEKSCINFVDLLSVTKIKVKTNQETLVKLPTEMVFNNSQVYVRESIMQKLKQANEKLSKNNKDYKLIVLEGYRSLSSQIKQFDEVYKSLSSKYKDLCEIEIYEQCHKQIAFPEVSGHPTGGAVDVCIFDKKENKILDFGSCWKDYTQDRKNYTFSPEVSRRAQNNRKLLKKVMTMQGFYQYPAEWWHFSYGDKEWAVANKINYALYSQIDFK